MGKSPKCRCAGGIRDEMDPRCPRAVFHMMPTPIVEDPSLSRSHVHRLAVAVETDLRLRVYRNVHSHARMPVVIDIGMHGYARARRQAHQP